MIADEQVFAQHELGFQKALNQVAHFFKVPHDRLDTFDFRFDMVDGKLVRVYDSLTFEHVQSATATTPPPIVEDVNSYFC